jgi:hypothetical protein
MQVIVRISSPHNFMGILMEIVKVRDCQKLKQFSFTTKTDGFRLIHLDISFTLLTGKDFLRVVDFVQQDPRPL